MSNIWVYDRLQDFHSFAYQHGDIVLGGLSITAVADFLLEAYQITTVDLTDVHVIHSQATNLDDLYIDGVRLHQQLEASFDNLRPLWSGQHAEAYLPPVKTAFAIEHDLLPTTTGGILSYNMGMVLQTFQHNGTVHHNWKNHTNAMYGVKAEVESILYEIAGSQVATLALQTVPVADLIAAAADALGLTWLVKRLRDAWTTWSKLQKLLAVLVIIAAIGGTIWFEHELTVWITASLLASTAAGAYDWKTPDGNALPEDLKKIADDLYGKFADALKNLGLSEELIRQLIAFIAVTIASYCTAGEADAITQSIIDSLPNNNGLKDTLSNLKDGATALGFKRLLYIAADKLAKGFSIVGFELGYIDIENIPRDVDITAKKDGITYLIESGGNKKGGLDDTKGNINLSKSKYKKFQDQMNQLIVRAQTHMPTAIPQFYIETPTDPEPSLDSIDLINGNSPWDKFFRAKIYAEKVLGTNNVFGIPSGTSTCQPAKTFNNPEKQLLPTFP